MRRFDPAYVELRAAVARRARSATPRVVHCVHRNAAGAPDGDVGGIVLVNSMIHEFDIRAVAARRPAVGGHGASRRRVPDGALQDPQVAVLETAGGRRRHRRGLRQRAVRLRHPAARSSATEGTVALTPPYGLVGTRDRQRRRPPGEVATSWRGSPTPTGSSCRRGSPACTPATRRTPRPGTATSPTSPPSPPSSRCTAVAGSRCRRRSARRSTAERRLGSGDVAIPGWPGNLSLVVGCNPRQVTEVPHRCDGSDP